MKSLKILKDSALVLLALILVPTAIFCVQAKASFLIVTSRSMEPTIKAGDTVLTRQIPRTAVKSREIIVLPVPDNAALKYSHRVISAQNLASGTLLKTKGDANPNADSWNMKVTSDRVPEVMAVIPTASIFNGPISRRTIFLALFYTGVLLFGVALWRLVRAHI